MNNRVRSLFFFALLFAITLAGAGCVSIDGSTIAARKEKRIAEFQALSPEFQEAVNRGAIKAGMPEEAVYIAWGKPSQVLSGGNSNGEVITWIYSGTYVQDTSFFGRYSIHESYTPMAYTRASVNFQNGTVRDWQTFPHP